MGATDTLTSVTVPPAYRAWWNGDRVTLAEQSMPCPGCSAPLVLTPFIRGLFTQYGKHFLCPQCPHK